MKSAHSKGKGQSSGPEDVLAELRRIEASDEFRNAPRLKRFLRHVVERTLEQDRSELKEYAIGLAVFDRDTSFDPRTDPIVRVQARQLRHRLERYYSASGSQADVVVYLPKGSYASEFRTRKRGSSVPRRRLRTAWVAAAVLSGAGVALLAFHWPADDSIDALAVLPFTNLSGEPDQEYLSDGLTDALITELAKVGPLTVISRASAMRFKGSDAPLTEIARRLGVDAVITGGVQREDGAVRVSVQLVEPDTGRQLWAQSYERDWGGALAIQIEIARTVVGEIGLELTPSEEAGLARYAQFQPEAYEAYLVGRSHAHRATPDGLETAEQYFRFAIEKDASSALAYSGLADVYRRSIFVGTRPPREGGPLALRAAQQAIDLDPELAQAHVQMCMVKHQYEWDWDGADAACRRARALSPGDAEALAYHAVILACRQDNQAAERAMTRALELDPFNPFLQFLRALQKNYVHDYEEAVRLLDGLLKFAPRMLNAHLTKWNSLNALGRKDEAYAALLEGWIAVGDEEMAGALREGHGEGAYAGAMKRMAELLVQRRMKPHMPPIVLAKAFDASGDAEAALDWLETAYAERDPSMGSLHVRARAFSKAVRESPRFGAILTALGLPNLPLEVLDQGSASRSASQVSAQRRTSPRAQGPKRRLSHSNYTSWTRSGALLLVNRLPTNKLRRACRSSRQR